MPMQVNTGGGLPDTSSQPGPIMRGVPSLTTPVEIGLHAAVLAVRGNEPYVLVVRQDDEARSGADRLPFGPFTPHDHSTLEGGLRNWVTKQSGLQLGYVEQLYTFSDSRRQAPDGGHQPHTVSISYLALTRYIEGQGGLRGTWRSWYEYFPWEDWRNGRPDILKTIIEPRLMGWLEHASPTNGSPRRGERVRMCFGLGGAQWDEERVLDRYELLYEAGLLEEARHAHKDSGNGWGSDTACFGQAMDCDHRRILATAVGRIRAKIKWRPVVFELMNDEFTLFELQRTVEAILGPHLHKQNFRRLVETAGLVEPTGDVRAKTGGRPAKLFRFRREVLLERPAPGVRVKIGRS